jgi:hypothetical protein
VQLPPHGQLSVHVRDKLRVVVWQGLGVRSDHVRLQSRTHARTAHARATHTHAPRTHAPHTHHTCTRHRITR